MEVVANIEKYWGIILFVLGLVFHAIWVYFQVGNQDKRLKKLEDDRELSDALVSELKAEIKAINAKLDILLEGYKKTR